tara:strand:- start:122 stop:361 length:240 start_codon:yes stop_codon:yes gene_type:complete
LFDQSGKSAEILPANRLENAVTPLKPSPEINVEELQYFFSSFSTFQQHPSARSSMTGRNNKDKKRRSESGGARFYFYRK